MQRVRMGVVAAAPQRSARLVLASISPPLAAALPTLTPCTAVAAAARSVQTARRWASGAPNSRAARSSKTHTGESMQRASPHLRIDPPAHSARPQLAPGSVLLQSIEWRDEEAHEMDLMRTHMLLKVTRYERTGTAGDGAAAAAAALSTAADQITVTTSALVLCAKDSVDTLIRAAHTLLAPHVSPSSPLESVSLLAGEHRSVFSIVHPLDLVRTILGLAPSGGVRGPVKTKLGSVRHDRTIMDLFRAGHAAFQIKLAPGFTAMRSGEIVPVSSSSSAPAASPIPLVLPLNGGRPVRRAQPSFFETNNVLVASAVLAMVILVGTLFSNSQNQYQSLKAKKRAQRAGTPDGDLEASFLTNVSRNVGAISESVGAATEAAKAAVAPSTSNVKVRVTGGKAAAAAATPATPTPSSSSSSLSDPDADEDDYAQLQARRQEMIREQLRRKEAASKERRE